MTVTKKTSPATAAAGSASVASAGLTSDEAKRRLEQSGPNSMPDTALHPLARAVAQLWAPVPGMELAIVIELALGRYVEGAIVAVLLGATQGWDFSRRAALRPR